ncbi:universal stress protein UspA [Haloprofundus marisrubri]|uniref:Universal stress protein UspA n=1 Tax=Haloprofundus marisrubri TaxID=1514971 RepID=A0A0W1R7I3_9EURY|nr:universal stress protein [Haloprofundus marisrubri]KTG08964.1 universal stress protein UspA [Haloprofundus marisrubri]
MAVHSAFGDESPAVAVPETEQQSDSDSDPANQTDEDAVFEHILVAVDEEMDERVGEVALALAARHGAQVDALSVVRMNASVDHWDMVVERREEAAEEALDALGEAAERAGVSLTKQLRYGTPADEIAAYADHHDVDLIVAGEPNRTGLRRFFSPKSVTDCVRRAASVPVLTV